MNKKHIIFIFIFLITVSFLFPQQGESANLKWMKYESDNFIIFYPEGYDYQAKESLYFLEKNI